MRLVDSHSLQVGVMGDPHGHYQESVALLQEKKYIDQNLRWIGGDRKLICVGDYVDRGHDGLKVIDFFMQLQAEAGSDRVITLLGNHDALLLSAYHFGHQKAGGPGGNFYDDWVMNGGQPRELETLTKEHIEWLSHLNAMAIVNGVLITHADSLLYTNYGDTIKTINASFQRLLAGRDPAEWDLFLDYFSDRLAFHRDPSLLHPFLKQFGGKVLIHGHTPIEYMCEDSSSPYIYASEQCVNVDACAYRGNPLIMYQF